MIFKDRNFLICHHRLKNRIHLHAPTFTITVLTGFIDGSVRLYDARTPEMAGLELVLDLVCTALGNKFTLVFSTLDCPSLIIHYGCVAFRRALVRIKEEVSASPTRRETINIFDDLELIEMKRKANTQSLKEMATLLSAEQMRKEFLS
ncbi:hypothetical protein QL285_037868 [Trifolium repens]|nr:hypothetical protein QL285_037868 [Trifolium repens]